MSQEFTFNATTGKLDLVTSDPDLSGYLKLDTANGPLTGDLNISKTLPKLTLTDEAGYDSLIRRGSTTNELAIESENITKIIGNGFNHAKLHGGAIAGGDITLGTNWTAEMWYKVPTGTAAHVSIFLNNGAAVFPFYISSLTNFNSTLASSRNLNWGITNVADSTYHHYMLVKTGGAAELFVDNVSKGSQNYPIGHIDALINGFGQYNGGNVSTYGIVGTVDEFVIWNKALDSGERAARYNAGAGAYATPSADTLAIWHNDAASGATMADSSGNGHDVSLGGSPTSANWVTALVSPPASLPSLNSILKVVDGVGSGDTAAITLGSYTGATGTANIYEGLSHRFNILGTSKLSLTSSDLGYTGATTLTSDAITTKPLILKGYSGQTANLQEWQNSSATILASVTKDGFLVIGTATANRNITVSSAASPFLGFKAGDVAKWTIGRDSTYGFTIFDDISTVYRLTIHETTKQMNYQGNIQITAPSSSTITEYFCKASGTGDSGAAQFTFLNSGGSRVSAFRYVPSGSTAYGGAESINFINVQNTPLTFGVNNLVKAAFATGSFYPWTTAQEDLGGTAKFWKDEYLSGTLYIRDTGLKVYSANDGYLDLSGDTGLRLRIGSTINAGFSASRSYFDTYCWFGDSDADAGYDGNWKNTFVGVSSSYGYIARFKSVGSNDNAVFTINTADNSNGMQIGCGKDGSQKYAKLDGQVSGGQVAQVRLMSNGTLTTGVCGQIYGTDATSYDISSLADYKGLFIRSVQGDRNRIALVQGHWSHSSSEIVFGRFDYANYNSCFAVGNDYDMNEGQTFYIYDVVNSKLKMMIDTTDGLIIPDKDTGSLYRIEVASGTLQATAL